MKKLLRYATLCGRCNRNALLEYQYEFVCYVCEFNVKRKNELSKFQRKKSTSFKGRITYATPNIIGICMEVNLLTQTITLDVIGTFLAYLNQKKLNVIEEILKMFDDLPDDFETNALIRKAGGIHKACNYALRMMK